jgi:DNA-binding LytR/AlgR family response regulator
MGLKAVIIEDEPRAARRLDKLLQEVEPGIEVLAVLESVEEGVAYFAKNPTLDIIFSDIQLADDLSFSIFKQINHPAPVIFTTAYDAYAIDAFKVNGIDYLLKPISADDLRVALNKYRSLVKAPEQPSASMSWEDLAALLTRQSSGQTEYKKRFMVRVGTQLKSIPVDEVVVAYSKDKATFLFTKQKRSYPVEISLDALQEQLDPQRFFRINRGFIISLEAQPEISAYSNSRLKLAIPGLEEELIIVARERTKEFKVWLGE